MSAADPATPPVLAASGPASPSAAAPRAVVRLLRSGRLSDAQRLRIRALYPELYAKFVAAD